MLLFTFVKDYVKGLINSLGPQNFGTDPECHHYTLLNKTNMHQ